MISQKIVCNRCMTECNGGGFAVTHKVYEDRVIILIEPLTKITANTLSHYCGKHCLMMAINEMVDDIASKEVGDGMS